MNATTLVVEAFGTSVEGTLREHHRALGSRSLARLESGRDA